jgi:hypothetical protein
MSLRVRVATAVVLVLASGATAVLPAAAEPAATHKLIVTVAKNLPPAAEKQLSVLILITQNGGPPSAAGVDASKPLTVYLANRGLYRVKAEINASCKGTCAASYRISGSANHKLKVVPSCRLRSSGFVCSKVKIVRVY